MARCLFNILTATLSQFHRKGNIFSHALHVARETLESEKMPAFIMVFPAMCAVRLPSMLGRGEKGSKVREDNGADSTARRKARRDGKPLPAKKLARAMGLARSALPIAGQEWD